MSLHDSAAVSITATILHSVGVLGLMFALAGFLLWHHRWRQDLPRDRIRTQTVAVFWGSAVANLVGGALRTIQPGHPGLLQFTHSLWVQAMVWKHLFVVLCLAGLFYLIYTVMPWLERRLAAGRRDERMPPAQAVSVTLVILGIVGASVLGAFAQAAPVEAPSDDEGGGGDGALEPMQPQAQTVYHNATGSLTSAPPLAPDTASGSFQVGEGTVALRAALTWSDTNADLTLQLLSPDGEATDGAVDGAGTRVAEVPSPLPGTWSYTIGSNGAANTGWSLSIQVSENPRNEVVLSDQVTIAGAGFFEINTEMPRNGTLCWGWSSDGELEFDVHSHFDDEVQYYVQRTSDGEAACFSNDREGVYSLLWAPVGNTPVQLDYRVWGEFTVHSYSP